MGNLAAAILVTFGILFLGFFVLIIFLALWGTVQVILTELNNLDKWIENLSIKK